MSTLTSLQCRVMPCITDWCSGSSTVPPSSAAGALDVPRLPACLRGRPCPKRCSRRHVWVDFSGLGHDLKNLMSYAPQRALSGYGRADVCRTSAGRSSGPSESVRFYRTPPVYYHAQPQDNSLYRAVEVRLEQFWRVVVSSKALRRRRLTTS